MDRDRKKVRVWKKRVYPTRSQKLWGDGKRLKKWAKGSDDVSDLDHQRR
jgi:predicted heme/steroid binding protein